MSFESTSWTSTVPHPFATAPGAGLGNTRRKVATVAFESGFAAEPMGSDYALPGSNVVAQGPFRVSKKPVQAGQIPAALIQLYFTDRGAINQGSLDQGIYTPLKGRGFRMSSATKFEPISVQWGWRKQAAADKYTKDLYFPVVVSPKGIAGMVYSGSAISSAELMDANFAPTAVLLAKLPKQIWVYTFAVTNQNNQFTDADGAQVLTLLKAAWSNTLPQAGAKAYGYVTLLGADPAMFNGSAPGPAPEPPSEKKGGWLLWLALAATAYSQMG